MKTLRLVVLGLWSLGTFVQAQAPVVEAGGAATDRTPVLLAQAPNPNNELVVTLYNQLEALQREVQTLRGIVEEQSFQLRQMESEQRDRYLDIDRRLGGLSTGAAPGLDPNGPNNDPGQSAGEGQTFSGQPGQTGPGQVAPGQINPGLIVPGQQRAGDPLASNPSRPGFGTPPTDSGSQFPAARNDAVLPGQSAGQANAGGAPGTVAGTPVDQMDDQELYRTALALLLEQNQYEESIRLFQLYTGKFPQGRYLTNAYYWQGEALLLVSRYDEARDVFNKILTDYPQDPKAAGAMLKLGVAYRQMGDAALAARTWQEIATRYPENLTEIGFAQDYLDQL